MAGLIARKRESDLTPEEEQELNTWIAEDPSRQKRVAKLLEETALVAREEIPDTPEIRRAFAQTWARINRSATKPVPGFAPRIWRYAAAILILLATSLGIYYSLFYHPVSIEYTSISAPGSSKAFLVSEDHGEVKLGETPEIKRIISREGITLIDSSSLLTLQTLDTLGIPHTQIHSHTLIVPRGGEYSVLLSDGTHIILNSDSRLVFPDHFRGEIRRVELEGEAYFRVARGARPFIVHADEMDVRVYGTEFNLSVYPDGNYVHATLVEGSVGVKIVGNQEQEFRISPGQQVLIDHSTGGISVNEIDTDLATAWIHGMFRFDNEQLGTILMKLARWYDFEYHFTEAGLEQKSFTCDLPRYDDITPILEMISSASDVEFRVKNEKLMVRKKQ